eukprot:TRINITY_DN2870_c0_g1_i10.p1 TRINITY_DN2870_c0_g1~~TRINITY_DN2870_c0_g1_i10.p1  ORF type:complete len:218 (+),score=47.92 TRINITY_DN2870_c0_g1_i10:68-655(+)
MARGRALPLTVLLLMAGSAMYSMTAPAFLTPSGMGRREALQMVGSAMAVTLGVQSALADAQGEPTVAFVKNLPRVMKLQDAVDKGDLKAVLRGEKDFKRLNTYWRNDPQAFKYMRDLSEELLDAAYEGKTDEVKKLYAKYVSKKEIVTMNSLPPPPAGKAVTLGSYAANKYQDDPAKSAKLPFFGGQQFDGDYSK